MNAYQKFNRLAEQVTNEIIEQLEQGKSIWQKPWSLHGLPKNYGSGRPYEGFNAFYLNYVTEKNNYTAPYFITFKQAQEMGGRVRKGQKGIPIVYWKIYEAKQSEHPKDQDAAHKDKEGKKFVPFLWTVFNIDQVEGVEFRLPEIPARGGQLPLPQPKDSARRHAGLLCANHGHRAGTGARPFPLPRGLPRHPLP